MDPNFEDETEPPFPFSNFQPIPLPLDPTVEVFIFDIINLTINTDFLQNI